jgi:hypothetical protein
LSTLGDLESQRLACRYGEDPRCKPAATATVLVLVIRLIDAAASATPEFEVDLRDGRGNGKRLQPARVREHLAARIARLWSTRGGSRWQAKHRYQRHHQRNDERNGRCTSRKRDVRSIS